MDDAVSVSSLLIGLASGGVVNTSVLIWLAIQYVKITTKVAVLTTHVSYLKREVAYVNGRAEESDEKEIE